MHFGTNVTRYEVHVQNTVSGDPYLLRIANHGSSKRMNRSPDPSTSSRSRGPTTTVESDQNDFDAFVGFRRRDSQYGQCRTCGLERGVIGTIAGVVGIA